MSEVLKEEGRYRVRLVPDESYSFNPRTDYDHIDHAITLPTNAYADIDSDFGPLNDVWNRLVYEYRWSEAAEIFERYCRVYNVAVTLYDTPNNGANAIWYLMAEDLHEVNDPAEYLKAQRDEYRSWAEGDVWGYVVDEKRRWVRDDTDDPVPETREDWEETDDSCWGYIGHQWAEEAALEALEYHVKKGAE